MALRHEFSQSLIDNKSNVNIRDIRGLHPLQSVMLRDEDLKTRIKSVKTLLEEKATYTMNDMPKWGIDEWSANSYYKTPLHLALDCGQCILIPLFLAFGEDYFSSIKHMSDDKPQCECNRNCKSIEFYQNKSRLENAIYVGNYIAVLYALQDSSTRIPNELLVNIRGTKELITSSYYEKLEDWDKEQIAANHKEIRSLICGGEKWKEKSSHLFPINYNSCVDTCRKIPHLIFAQIVLVEHIFSFISRIDLHNENAQ